MRLLYASQSSFGGIKSTNPIEVQGNEVSIFQSAKSLTVFVQSLWKKSASPVTWFDGKMWIFIINYLPFIGKGTDLNHRSWAPSFIQPLFPEMKILDWHQSLKQFFISVSYHILVATLTLMALF